MSPVYLSPNHKILTLNPRLKRQTETKLSLTTNNPTNPTKANNKTVHKVDLVLSSNTTLQVTTGHWNTRQNVQETLKKFFIKVNSYFTVLSQGQESCQLSRKRRKSQTTHTTAYRIEAAESEKILKRLLHQQKELEETIIYPLFNVAIISNSTRQEHCLQEQNTTDNLSLSPPSLHPHLRNIPAAPVGSRWCGYSKMVGAADRPIG